MRECRRILLDGHPSVVTGESSRTGYAINEFCSGTLG